MKDRKVMSLTILVVLTVILWIADFLYPNAYLQRSFYTIFIVAVTYFLFKTLFEEVFIKRIQESKTRYSFKKAVSILYLIVLCGIILRIWVETTQTLLVSYGLIAAGLAIALQDLFKNFVGGIILFLTRVYRVGDRIEVDSKYGDVIDIGLLYSTLLEVKGWIGGEQATGRLMVIPNNHIISGAVYNYTKDHNFIWDEITIPITYDSNWKEAAQKFLEIVRKETETITKEAEKEVLKTEEKYYLSKQVMEPEVYLSLTDNWITCSIRYTTEVRERRVVHDRLSRILLDEIQKNDNICIASTTINITGLPDITLKK